MVKKRSKTNLDADIKKAESKSGGKSGTDVAQFNPMDLLPKEAVAHLETSRREALMGFKVALDGLFDSLIK